MDAAIAAMWRTDLLSKEYQQGIGTLARKNGQFCCLGVLCEQAVRAGIVTRKLVDLRYQYTAVNDAGDCEGGVLPKAVMEWAGMKSDNGKYYFDGVTRSLAEDNDDRGTSFETLAAFIEKNFANL